MDKKIKIGELDARTMLYTELKTTGGDPSFLFEILRGILDNREWERLDGENGQPVGSLRKLIEAPLPTGVGQSVEKIRALLKVEHKHGNFKHEWLEALRVDFEREVSEALPNNGQLGNGRDSSHYNIIATERQGTSAEYTTRRLLRDRPDLAEHVIEGRMSANAAAIEAGFRKRKIQVYPDDSDGTVSLLAKHCDDEILRAIRDGINELLGE